MANIASRTTANGVVGGLTVFSGIGSLGLLLLRALGFVDLALNIKDTWTLFSDPKINWEGIYLLVFFICCGLLVAINSDILYRVGGEKLKKRREGWDWSAQRAMGYIAQRSIISTAMSDPKRFEMAISAFNELAKLGKIPAKGRKPGSSIIEKVPKDLWKDGFVPINSVNSQFGTGGKLCVMRDGEQEVLYEGLIVQSARIVKIWPERQDFHHV